MSMALLIFLQFFVFFLLAQPFCVCSSFPKEALPTRSGYLPINPSTGSAIFYVFYEAQNPSSSPSQTPLLIFLEGGPGESTMVSNFFELGPWRVNSNLSLEPNPGSWNRIFGLLFLDNPIGTGFSIAATPEEIPRDEAAVAEQLYTAITSFLQLDPVFKSRPLYITGESYAGKYVPAIGSHILNKNEVLSESERLNIAGFAIGNGMVDPEIQVGTHALQAYYLGLINERQKEELEKIQEEAINLVHMGKWREATKARYRLLNVLRNMSGLASFFDYTRKHEYRFHLVTEFLQSKEVKKALKANESIVFNDYSEVVGDALYADEMKSVKSLVEFLVRTSKVLLYEGQYYLADGVVATEAWIKTMKWEGIEKFLKAERKVWKVKEELAGYVQKWASLSHVVVLRAGHLVPHDQPTNSQAMIEDWVLEKGLFRNGQENEDLFIYESSV